MAARKLIFHSASPKETQSLGESIGKMARRGDVILLSGPLGAGKTCLAQGIACGMGIKETPPSPSYVLVREFSGEIPLYHMDLYRLELEEIEELGVQDYLLGKGVCVIEWAEKAESLMPKDSLSINLSYAGDSGREILIDACGDRYEDMSRQIEYTFGHGLKDGA